MSGKQSPYETIRHKLESDMLSASSLRTKPEQQGFVNRTFLSIHQAYKTKQVHHAEYIKLINRLAAYRQGAYNDYIDMLAGAAQMNALELVIQGEMAQFSPDAARERQHTITDLTGVKPVEPDTGE